MDDLPDLPFERILSYLSLQDRLRARTVSRGWRKKFASPVTNLYCSDIRPIERKKVSRALFRNYISSTRFQRFINTFDESILSNLRRLYLYDLSEKQVAAYNLALNSFLQLEELDIVCAGTNDPKLGVAFDLNLPMLNSIRLFGFERFEMLILDTPKLRMVNLVNCPRLELVDAKSVETLNIDRLDQILVKKLKNLRYLFYRYDCPEVDSTLLFDLEHLQEIHLGDLPELAGNVALAKDFSIAAFLMSFSPPRADISKLIQQQQRYGRTDLKIFLKGSLYSGPA